MRPGSPCGERVHVERRRHARGHLARVAEHGQASEDHVVRLAAQARARGEEAPQVLASHGAAGSRANPQGVFWKSASLHSPGSSKACATRSTGALEHRPPARDVVTAAQPLALPAVDHAASPGDQGGRLRSAGGEQARREDRVPPVEVQAAGALALAREERLERRRGAHGHRGELEAEGFAEAGDRPDAGVTGGARLHPGDGHPAGAAAGGQCRLGQRLAEAGRAQLRAECCVSHTIQHIIWRSSLTIPRRGGSSAPPGGVSAIALRRAGA